VSDLAFGTLYPSVCNCGWCFLLSLVQIFEYATCFGPTEHLHMYNLVCRSLSNCYCRGFFLRLALCRRAYVPYLRF
jgi:hypothetical protein